ncbi:MAG: RpiB/LacA/LacB family sugar-phosphate isomerase [Chloroflexota bacterium]|nr:MAG: RpiB/LacA/LacB family sugar-phosphate isomerase [Chloroflexota bacterium]
MKLVVGCDHAGFPLKGPVIAALREWGHEIVAEVGSQLGERADFPDIARALSVPIRDGRAERGIMVCGTGIGACMAANKIPGVRAALCHDVYSAHQCVEHDDANVLCLGAQVIGDKLALDLVRTYLGATMSDDPYFRGRLVAMAEMERAAARELAGR